MDWTSPFIVYRVSPDGKLEEVFHAEDLKKAKYWLSYIALPGDLLCRTPIHPKHSKATKCAEYCQHKEDGKPCSEEDKWKLHAKGKNFDFRFPEEQITKPS